MNTPSAVSTGLGCLLLCTGVLAVTPGCADSEPFPEVDGPGATEGPAPAPVALANGGHVLDEYVLQVRPREHTTKLIHLKRGASSRPGFSAQSVDTINVVQDNIPNSGPAGSVELNTDPNTIFYGATSCPSHVAASFCGDVTLNSFYTRPLNNVFVQVTSITGTYGNDLSTDHNAMNSDAAPSWMTGTSSMGLWKYTATSATTAGVIGTSPNNSGTRTWEFKDPDGADTNILLRVVATLSYKDYSRATFTQAFVNTCTATTNDNSANGNDVTLPIPFPFTFYAVQATTTSTFNRNGVLTVGGGAPPSAVDNFTFKNTALPDNMAHISASPGIYVFWDKLNYNPSPTGICHGSSGTAPNRQFIYTWRNMKGFTNTANTMGVNFNVVLSEGTDTIDMVYGPMGGSSSVNDPSYPTITYAQRAQGAKAVIGVQGPNGAVNISTPNPAAIGTPTVIPLSASSTNVAYRYTPIP